MKKEALNGIKARRLQRRLKINRVHLAGLLTLLWDIEGPVNWPRGDIGRLTNEDIAVSLEWADDPDTLVEALVASGIIDKHPDDNVRLIVHGWSKHSPNWLKGVVKRTTEGFFSLDDAEPSGLPGQQPGKQPESATQGQLLPSGGESDEDEVGRNGPVSNLGQLPGSATQGQQPGSPTLKTQDSRPKTQDPRKEPSSSSSSLKAQGDQQAATEAARAILHRLRDEHPRRPDPFANKAQRVFLWRLGAMVIDDKFEVIDDDDVEDMLDLMKGKELSKPVPYLRTLVRESLDVKGANLNNLLRTIDVPEFVTHPRPVTNLVTDADEDGGT